MIKKKKPSRITNQTCLTTFIDNKLWKQLDDYSRDSGILKKAIVREAITMYLKHKRNK